MADVESKSIPHKLPSSHWLKATGQCVLERYLSATMPIGFSADSVMHPGIGRGVPTDTTGNIRKVSDFRKFVVIFSLLHNNLSFLASHVFIV